MTECPTRRIIPPLGLEQLAGDERTRCEKLTVRAATIITQLALESLHDDETVVQGYCLAANVVVPLPLAERLQAAYEAFTAGHGRLGEIAWSDAGSVLVAGMEHLAAGSPVRPPPSPAHGSGTPAILEAP